MDAAFPPGMRLEKLAKELRRQIRAFASGEGRVDDWLHPRALSAQNKHGCVTRILLDGDAVAGFHTLANGELAIDQVPAELFPGGQPPQRPPRTVTLAWLGVDQRYVRKGIGRALAFNALAYCYGAYQLIPFVAVIVDALTPRSTTFFQNMGFAVIPGTEGTIPGLSAKLYMSAATLIAAVEEPPAAEGGTPA